MSSIRAAAPSQSLACRDRPTFAVLEDLHLLERDQAARHHPIEHRQERIDLLLRVDDLDHDRQVLGEAQDLGRVDVARMPEPDVPTQHRGAAELHFPGLEHDRLIERQALEFVVLAEEDAEQDGVARDVHHQTHFIALMLAASTWPAQTATRHATTEPTTLPPARSHSPSFIRLSVCRLNDEKVVYPPQKPTMTNCRVMVPA